MSNPGSASYLAEQLATASHLTVLILSCSVCFMLNYSSVSLCDNGTCDKCSLFAVLEASLSEFQAQLCSMDCQLPSASLR